MGIMDLGGKADSIQGMAEGNRDMIPDLTMKAGQNAGNIATNSDAIGMIFPARVNMASDDIASAQTTID